MINKTILGFTIVEILIVVVVIGIISSITTISYQGIQLRSRNTQTASAVSVYRDALILYRQTNGAYPESTVAGKRPCLGNDYTGTTCFFGAGTVDTTLMSTLQTVAGGSLPMPAMPNLSLRGIVYSPPSADYRIDGASYNLATPISFLTYSVEGSSTSCPIGPVASKPLNMNVLWFSSTPPANGQTYAVSGIYPVQCYVPLPYK